MAKRTATNPAKGRAQKRSSAVGKSYTEEDLKLALLPIPEEFLREEMSFWSWPDSPEDDLWFEMSDTLEVLLKDVGLDARERKLLWPNAGPLDLNKSIRHINQQYPDFPEDKITEFLIFWIEALYVPQGCSDCKMDELERLTERWVADLEKGEN
jgi:hypothetical protein